MKFEDYSIAPNIKKNLSKLGFRRPTDIQFKSIPPILKGEDVLAIAQTGTGKTAAFAIPVINILDEKKGKQRRPDGIKCIVMVPTRELAIQITGVFEMLAKHTKVKIFGVIGGVEQDKQIARLQKDLDILVVTPGRMFDLVSQGYLKLNRVEILVLDEADLMLDLGFIKDIRDLIKFLPKRRQTLFFSATIDKKIKKLAYSLVRNAIRIEISPKDRISKNIHHAVAFIKMDDKRFFLERFINENPDSKILVFVRTKVRAERIAKAMMRVGLEAQTIHGDKEQEDRLEVMNRFKRGYFKVMIATDVSARGIDIPNVDYVVNYDLPEQTELYVHRVGRTGRGAQKGNAISFCSPDEQKHLEAIEEYLGVPIEILEIDKKDYESTIRFSKDTNESIKSLMKEIEEFENKKRKKRKKK